MKAKGYLQYLGCAVFLLGVFVLPSAAKTGKCTTTFQDAGCNATNTCGRSGTACVIRITATDPKNPSGNAQAVPLDSSGSPLPTPNGNICVDGAAGIKWAAHPDTPGSYLHVYFDTQNPFKRKHGKKVNVKGGTAAGYSSPTRKKTTDYADGACFNFTIEKYCKDGENGQCTAPTDPTVIIGDPARVGVPHP